MHICIASKIEKGRWSWHARTYRFSTTLEDAQEGPGLRTAKSREKDLPLSLMVLACKNGYQRSKNGAMRSTVGPYDPISAYHSGKDAVIGLPRVMVG